MASSVVIAIKRKIMSIENAEKYPPFAGVLLYFLRRELTILFNDLHELVKQMAVF